MFQITQMSTDLALTALTLLSAYAINVAHKMTAKIKAETEKIKNQEQRTLLQNAIDDVDELVTKTVKQIEQTTAKDLRAAVKEGKMDKSALEVLAKQAYLEISEALTPEVKDLIQKNFGNISTYLTKTIESTVLDLKNSSTVS